MKKKIISILLVTLVFLNAMPTLAFAKGTADEWDGTIATEFAGGSGTESDPYQIATGAQLAFLSQEINSFTDDNIDYRTSYFVLANDINLNDFPWTPIGHTIDNLNSQQYFAGDFDGNNHTISGMKISLSSPAAATLTGLFGVSEANIHDLNVSGNIDITGNVQINYVAGICGYLAGDIDNCTSNVNITLTGDTNTCFIGGIAGCLDVGFTISNCINKGNISIPNTTAFPRAGGVVGCMDNNTTVASCKNEGNVTVKMGMVGGIVGEMITSGNPGTVTVKNSYNIGDVQMTGAASDSCVGGIVGGMHALCYAAPSDAGAVLENCFSTGIVSMVFVSGTGTCGPVYGDTKLETEGTSTTTNCYYLNEAADHATNQNGTQITEGDLHDVDFLNNISGGVEDIWTQSNTDAVVLKNEIADYTAVSAAIGEIPDDLTVYTDETVHAVTDAVNAVVYNRLKSEQSIVDGYAEALKNAVAALQYKNADYSKVDEAIAKIPADLSIYTDATVKALNDAKNAVVRDKNITEQAMVDGYAAAIEHAISNLSKKPSDASTNANSPKTGDNSNIALWTLLLCVSGTTLTGTTVYGRKKEQVK